MISDDIFMVDIQTDPIKHQNVKKLRETNIVNISVFHSKYRIGFEIPTPASPNLQLFCNQKMLKKKQTILSRILIAALLVLLP